MQSVTPSEHETSLHAETVARELHAGQYYYGTERHEPRDFIDFHLLPGVSIIRQLGGTPDDEAIFWLHDTVEDTDTSLADLESRKLPPRIVEGVDLLTMWPGQSHQEYMRRLAAQSQANRLKIIDSKINLDATLELAPNMSAEERQICLRKYAGNIVFLAPYFHQTGRQTPWSKFVIDQTVRAESILGGPRSEQAAKPLSQSLPLPSFAS